MTTSKDITVNGIDITVHSDGSISKPYYGKTNRIFGSIAKGYRLIGLGGKSFRMHRIVAQAFLSDFSDFPEVDHIDGDKTNNDISNLRMATPSTNLWGHQAKPKGCSSQYRGVTWNKAGGKWHAQCTIDYKQRYLGSFDDEREAAIARDTYVFSQGYELEGLNFPDCFIGLQCP